MKFFHSVYYSLTVSTNAKLSFSGDDKLQDMCVTGLLKLSGYLRDYTALIPYSEAPQAINNGSELL